VGNYFFQNYKIRKYFSTKKFVKSVLYKIFCKKKTQQFPAIFFHNKMLSISYEKKIQNKIGMRHEFFSCEKRV